MAETEPNFLFTSSPYARYRRAEVCARPVGMQGAAMEARRSTDNVSLLKTDVPGPSQAGEKRFKRRFALQQIKVTFLGFDHVAINWSLGGFLVEDRHPRLELGTSVSGVLAVRGTEGRFRFSAEFVRRDVRTKDLAFRFVNPSKALLDVLMRITN